MFYKFLYPVVYFSVYGLVYSGGIDYIGSCKSNYHTITTTLYISGADPGFEVRGAHIKKLRWAEGGVKIFGVFRVENHDFMPKNLIFSNFRGGMCAPLIRPCIFQLYLSFTAHLYLFFIMYVCVWYCLFACVCCIAYLL